MGLRASARQRLLVSISEITVMACWLVGWLVPSAFHGRTWDGSNKKSGLPQSPPPYLGISRKFYQFILLLPLETLPKALQTQALTALTSNFGLVGLVQYAW